MAVVLSRIVSLCALGLLGCTALTVLDQSDPYQLLPFPEIAYRWDDPIATGTTTLLPDRLRLTTTVPRRTEACSALLDAASCRDADGDGLTDLWERIALHRLRPFVRMHAEEPLFRDYYGQVVAVGRVTPAADSHIRIILMMLYSYDYGRCGEEQHRGDIERVVLDLVEVDDTTTDVVGLYTAAHEGKSAGIDRSVLLTGDQFGEAEFAIDEVTGMPRWVVYASIGKHATYPSAGACSAGFVLCLRDDCTAGSDTRYTLLFDIYDVGEPDALDFEFEGGMADSPYRATTPPPSPEQVWGAVDYCGPIPEFSVGGYSSACCGPMREKLLLDPFQ